jgi:hypothetical protein
MSKAPVLTFEWQMLWCDIRIVVTVTPASLAKETVAASPLASPFAQIFISLQV